jgi:hypothetical protein
MPDPIEDALRMARPRWLPEREAIIRGLRLYESAKDPATFRIVRDVSISPEVIGGGNSSVDTGTGRPRDPNAPPPQPSPWPDPFPTDGSVDHSPFPDVGEADIVLIKVFGQNIGYPNSYGGWAADDCYVWGHHSDTGPYLLETGWMIPTGIVVTIGNIRFWGVEVRCKTPPYDGISLALLTHSNFALAFGGSGPYNVYQEDYGAWP